jgi:hypothetical protein
LAASPKVAKNLNEMQNPVPIARLNELTTNDSGYRHRISGSRGIPPAAQTVVQFGFLPLIESLIKLDRRNMRGKCNPLIRQPPSSLYPACFAIAGSGGTKMTP